MSISHAEKTAQDRELKEKRLRRIVDLMVEPGGWRTGTTNRSLADEWGIHVNTVDRYAGEASRYLRLSLGDPEDIRARLICQLESLVGDGVQKGSYLRDLVGALDLKAELLGLKKPKQVDAAHSRVEVTIIPYSESQNAVDDGPEVEPDATWTAEGHG